MKVLKISITLMICLAFIQIGFTQTESKKKIVVIEKVTDNDGKVTTKKIVKEGEEAEKYMKEKKAELGVGDDVKHIEKEIEIEIEEGDIREENVFVIKVEDEDGEENVIKWKGEGEMPAHIKDQLEKEGVDVEMIDVRGDEDGEEEIRVIVKKVGDQVRLGVVPENHVDGVEIMEVIEGSSAAKAGLMKGDIIYQIGDKTIGSDVQLRAALKKGGTPEIHFLRNGAKKSVKAELK